VFETLQRQARLGIDSWNPQDGELDAVAFRPISQPILRGSAPTRPRRLRPSPSRLVNPHACAVAVDATGADIDEAARYNLRFCQRCDEPDRSRIIATFCRRGREVKHGKRRCTQSIEAVQRVEIADDRYDAMAAQPRDVARPARETVKLRPPTQEIRGAQRDVAAANQQNPYHADSVNRKAMSLSCEGTRRDGDFTIRPMPHQITIKPGDHSFPCDDGETVLSAAMRADLMIPYGCRNGACGTCKSRILGGSVDYGSYQHSTLTDAEKQQNLVLLCVATPLADVMFEVREVRRAGDIQIRKFPCRVEKVDKPAPDVAVVSLKLPANERLRYLAGQYIDVLLKDGRRRSFSIATAPESEGLLELHIRHVPDGLFSGQLFNEFKGREILRFEGPFGAFYLREESDKPVILVAGGTGFAPIKAVIEHAIHQAIVRPMVLYWGVRSLVDLYLPQLPGEWQRTLRDFTFIPVLSEPRHDDHWPGRTGFVHKAVMADFADLSGYQVYACGGPAMIDAARKAFTGERGLPPQEFFADSFTYAAQAEVRT